MVHLHGELATRLDMQFLHLEASPQGHGLEIAPRPVVPEMLLLLPAVRLTRPRDAIAD